MEIERKFLIQKDRLPSNLSDYPKNELAQAYIITNPVLRIRQKNDSYILTYKGQGLMAREEAEFPLSEDAYQKLLTKTEGILIQKTRYKIPEQNNLTIELDVFHGCLSGLYLAEVEFPDETSAFAYQPPAWFGREVTQETTFHNSTLSRMTPDAIDNLLSDLSSQEHDS